MSGKNAETGKNICREKFPVPDPVYFSVSYLKLSIIRHAEAVDLDDYRTRCAACL